MGKPIPDASSVAKKWADRAGTSGAELVAKAKQSTWKTEAAAGEANYKRAMSDVISKELRKKGIEKSSDTAWQNGIEQNMDRYETGVKNSEGKMQAGMTTVLNDIKAGMAALPPKGPKGSSENYKRSEMMGKALHDAKVRRMG
jgi:hypothetical protein